MNQQFSMVMFIVFFRLKLMNYIKIQIIKSILNQLLVLKSKLGHQIFLFSLKQNFWSYIGLMKIHLFSKRLLLPVFMIDKVFAISNPNETNGKNQRWWHDSLNDEVWFGFFV